MGPHPDGHGGVVRGRRRGSNAVAHATATAAAASALAGATTVEATGASCLAGATAATITGAVRLATAASGGSTWRPDDTDGCSGDVAGSRHDVAYGPARRSAGAAVRSRSE